MTEHRDGLRLADDLTLLTCDNRPDIDFGASDER